MFALGASEIGILVLLLIAVLLSIFIPWRIWSIRNEVNETKKRLNKLIELHGGDSLSKTGKKAPRCKVCRMVNTDKDVWCIFCGTKFTGSIQDSVSSYQPHFYHRNPPIRH